MIGKHLTTAAALLTIAAGQPAARPAPALTGKSAPATTVNCILASNVFAQKETDAKQRELAQQMLFFYLGRLNPKTTSVELKSALRLAGEGLKGVDAATLMNSCLAEFRTTSQMLQTAGQQLQQGK